MARYCYCFEANPNSIPLLKEHRKNVFNYAISNEDKDQVNFHIVNINPNWTASFSAIDISEEYKKIFNWKDEYKVTEIKVPRRHLALLLKMK